MTKWFQIGVALLLIIAGLLALPIETKVKRYLKGNADDVTPSLAGPVFNLGGGGPDVDEAIQWMINQVRGCTNCATKVDVVVIRASGSDGYNLPIYAMKGVDSVETLFINNRDDANKPEVLDKVKKAEVIFFAGGDQCKYIRNWKNTKLKAAVESVYKRGGGIGGTSAGAMIQGDYIFNACENSVDARDALEDPYRNITFTYNFFTWKNLNGTIVDTHFDKRERMGRLMAFIARQIKDGVSSSALGIAVSEGTSIVVDKNGLAKVMGKGSVYFVLGDHKPEVCEPRTPLTFSNYKIWKVRSGGTFNLKNRPISGYYLRSVKRGRINSNPY
ncbi:cyanophycinase [Cylindrospermum sp. FACHB-282]|uniref:cyanophycinase n=1 Tax=Cylindrospermum sp. FACHB-282 TaxID=2692794 RepID=UPI00168274F0|nr:Type 1 glutamine amidotransferase-like domain-containing protein [Cylindrospermum sp. FACHB-282]MBD2384108.1 Type 1 glutamine amidotransferase-like domain-containing protein [Cylindrospermum sp. FACHB-282]